MGKNACPEITPAFLDDDMSQSEITTEAILTQLEPIASLSVPLLRQKFSPQEAAKKLDKWDLLI